MKVNERWKEYCEGLYTGNEDEITFEITEREPPPLREEIKRALLKASLHKASGPDGVATELLRFGGDMTLTMLHKICRLLMYGYRESGPTIGRNRYLSLYRKKGIRSVARITGP